MPQWEGIEDASPQVKAVWLARQKLDDDAPNDHLPWKPLRKKDCQTLNSKHAEEKEIYIEGGRATAFPSDGNLAYNFIRGPARQLDYATWFKVQDENKKKPKEEYLEPIFDKQDSHLLEALYQKVVAASSSLGEGLASVLDEDLTLSDASKVKVVQFSNNLSLRCYPTGWYNSVHRNSYLLQRGYGEYHVAGEDDEAKLGPVQHLVFVIHGIGEAMFSRDTVSLPSMIATTDNTRLSIQQKQVADWQKKCQETWTEPPNRIELIPIEWFDQLHNENSSWAKSLRNTTLPTIPALRMLANDVILDVLLYMTPSFCKAVLECVTNEIQRVYDKFCQVHPEFLQGGGSCSLVGHSLGSMIVWDLLAIRKQHLEQKQKQPQPPSTGGAAVFAAQQELPTNPSANGSWGPSLTKFLDRTIPFDPESTIFLGSPVGMFLTLRGAHGAFDQLRTEQSVLDKQSDGKTETTVEAVATETLATSPSGGDTPKHEDITRESDVSPFTLPTKQLYNIFHPSDPIAYRIEPLLLSPELEPDMLPPPLYLTAPGQDVRLHVKARQIGEEIRKSLQVQKNTWNSLLNSAVSVLSSHEQGTSSDPGTRALASGQALVFPLGGSSPRVDFSFQPNVVDSEYISAVTAHASYFTNSDFHDFIISLMAANEK